MTLQLAVKNKENPIVFLDIAIGGQPAGRIKFELYKDVVPKTAENFRQLYGRVNPFFLFFF
jgi:hypothetical protein